MSRPDVADLTPEDLLDEGERWPVTASEPLLTLGPFSVRRDEVTTPDGSEAFDRLVLEHPGAVVVLAVDADDRALVLRQYRHAVGMRLVELPAGLLDAPGEEPLLAARRELLEEAGLEAATWDRLAVMHSSPGINTERVEIFLARDLSARPDRGGFVPEHEEAHMTPHWVPMADLVAAVTEGRLTNAPLIIGVLAFAARDRG